MSVVLRFGETGASSIVGMPLHTRVRAAVRRCLADEIEELIALLDRLHGDPDFEPDADDEPSLGWSATMALGSADDREEDVGDEREPDEDREPALGWTDAEGQHGMQRFGEPGRWDDGEA